MAPQSSAKPLTGRKVLVILLTFFGVVCAANVALIYAATDTFPGLVVRNSYDASQIYDVERNAQTALGWRAAVDLTDGVLTANIHDRDGKPVRGLAVTALIGRPATNDGQRTVALTETDGLYVARTEMKQGVWRVEILAKGAGTQHFRAEARFYEPGAKG